ncbi:glycoside hydrolase family 16 protein [Nesterenkonia natronophila]|uniref:Beta-glucanase n=1 Tax=Nesterenkonia natronophila TaxID=2174932 RepID=A0A3A4F3G7_9MICC|nr:glycoside hydrolase family 16 protein [Nesterenkonia natronophila]RJN32398.1 glycosyl hydrolase family protein [Nesterenkonia natronophila]
MDADSFAFQQGLWTKSSHRLGRSLLEPSNVDTTGDALRLRLPRGSTNGAEIRSTESHGYARFEARLRVPDAPSSITGFFLYEPPDEAHEVDIEIFNDRSGKVMFTYYLAGKQVTRTHELPFDPTAGFHDYRFDYRADSVEFFADGELLETLHDEMPAGPLRLHLNAWFPTWHQGRVETEDHFVLVDHIRVIPQRPLAE